MADRYEAADSLTRRAEQVTTVALTLAGGLVLGTGVDGAIFNRPLLLCLSVAELCALVCLIAVSAVRMDDRADAVHWTTFVVFIAGVQALCLAT